ncbi:YdcF family protein [Sneathiella chinensis]|uniref:DUF218 domain-containing protein n=1 Tax=Sneathiella chinensis TaxID=349750 RepID=A0ABQ5U6S0_9PROT|nr:hypothetical protein [Sneathiella chinensis]GLQ07847.1 hypothetical protein GCM10007924_30690 [Sneathiella chinensis]
MLDYAFRKLIDGMSVPGLFLILLPLTLIYWLLTRRRGLFLTNILLLIFLSIPLTGKIILKPLEVGTLYQDLDAASLTGRVDVVAVISSGVHIDRYLREGVPTPTTFSQVRRAVKLSDRLGVPLIISGGSIRNGGLRESDYLTGLAAGRPNVYATDGAAGTIGHVQDIARLCKEKDFRHPLVFVAGHHALRTRLALQSYGVRDPLLVSTFRDSALRLKDVVPNFSGYLYWRQAIKEYAGLVYHIAGGQITL